MLKNMMKSEDNKIIEENDLQIGFSSIEQRNCLSKDSKVEVGPGKYIDREQPVQSAFHGSLTKLA